MKPTGLSTPTFRIARMLVIAFMLLVAVKFIATLALFPRFLASNPVLNIPSGWTLADITTGLASLGLPLTAYSWINIAGVTLSTLIYTTVGLVILKRKPNDWFALYLALVFLLFSTSANYSNDVVIWFYPVLEKPINLAGNLAWPMFFILFYLFPDGHFYPAWTKWFVVPFLAMSVLGTFSLAWSNSLWFILPALLFIFSGVGGQIHRYTRGSNPTERQQTRLVVYAVVVMVIVALSSLLLDQVTGPNPGIRMLVELTRTIILPLGMMLFPVSIAVAILRYRLWDMDILIRRTITYSLLTALIVLLYAGSVVLLQAVFGRSTGAQSPLVVVASTLLIAALFNPLRRRIQDGVDRRFYRQKYNAEHVLAAFGTTLRDEVDLDHLKGSILSVVDATMQPAHTTLWLREVKNRG